MEVPFSKNSQVSLLTDAVPGLPANVIRVGCELFFDEVLKALSAGRAVSLRGFGRFIPRFYLDSPNKRIGLVFRPSPQLRMQINRETDSSRTGGIIPFGGSDYEF